MTSNVTRRTALAAAAAGTLIPVAALAQGATTANATDAAWAELEAAKAAYEANRAAQDAWEAANVPERLHRANGPDWADYDDARAWRAARDEWGREMDAYKNPYDLDDDQLDAFCESIRDAQFTILETPAASVTDVERKLSIVAGLAHDNQIEEEWIEGVLADVRRINGRAA